MSMADSVSLFTEWGGPTLDMIWLKQRVTSATRTLPASVFGATRATVDRHPIRRMSAVACTPQLGVPGPWFDRLPHFRMEHTPSAGDELQSEYFVPRDVAVPALLELDRIRDRIAPLIQVSEIRTVAADAHWLSMAFGRPSVAFHFTWRPDPVAVRDLLPEIEEALRPFEPRPHWGKVFTMPPDEVRARYERMPAFEDLVHRLDPTGTFRNDFIDRYILGGRPIRGAHGSDETRV
jgi:xylitol oxidase